MEIEVIFVRFKAFLKLPIKNGGCKWVLGLRVRDVFIVEGRGQRSVSNTTVLGGQGHHEIKC